MAAKDYSQKFFKDRCAKIFVSSPWLTSASRSKKYHKEKESVFIWGHDHNGGWTSDAAVLRMSVMRILSP